MYTFKNQDYVNYIINQTKTHNIDNITRTHAYQNFYYHFPEIKWAFVASIVSRNAGWNMTDLKLIPFKKLLGKTERSRLFMTYERANWLIFSDAYPQLLTYKLSCKLHKPMFHLLSDFHVSTYMQKEWSYFWEFRDLERLMTALIINEQNVIHEPVLKQSFFSVHIFKDLPYRLQNMMYMNAVILPSKTQPLYGAFVHNFTHLSNRIALGKHLASIIYKTEHYSDLVNFTQTERHSGSRWDYEKYLELPFPKGPTLQKIYPPITHQDIIRNDWYKSRGVKKKWIDHSNSRLKTNIGKSFYRKRTFLFTYVSLKDQLLPKNNV
ncbi:DUF2515 family protein [Virgibacillus necropolis]|uniref:DUF2515 domain-containing protein n=1 Tax=Virgibacillus necropolis TaxID=163877 RepID=A0A221MD88_9BACI|nr:DUF2515 family protein [Virgibacillus necropolis]ASN05539.1 hypothetical protein CFK40_11215 [Virgibacillus necropolis]